MLTIYKPIGISCVDLIEQLKQKEQYKDVKMGFTGRLDEMAHGSMIILLGDETKKTKQFHDLNKVYKFRFIVGLETDTTSVLGMFQNKIDCNELNNDKICQEILKFNNTQFMQEYHVYSSYCPKHPNLKKPLWWWILNNRLDEIDEMPKKNVNIYDVKINNIKNVSLDDFMEESLENLSKIKKRNFRQDEIIKQWKKYYDKNKEQNVKFTEFECEIHVSSGFYVRQFVKDIGKQLNLNVVVTEIERLSYFNHF
jgi:tRNA pseudouridine(55) synthase